MAGGPRAAASDLPDQALDAAIFEGPRAVSARSVAAAAARTARRPPRRPRRPPGRRTRTSSTARTMSWSLSPAGRRPRACPRNVPTDARRSDDDDRPAGPDLDVYDIAFLAGGVRAGGRHRPGRPGRGRPGAGARAGRAGRCRARPRASGRGGRAGRRRHARTPVGRHDPLAARGRRPDDDLGPLPGRRGPAAPAARPPGAPRLEWSPTRGRAGRRCAGWRRAARDPAHDGGSALQVALHGRAAMPDADLRAAIFERPRRRSAPAPDAAPAPRGPPRSPTTATRASAAYRTRGAAGAGGGGRVRRWAAASTAASG